MKDRDLIVPSDNRLSHWLKASPGSCPYAYVTLGSGVWAIRGRKFPHGVVAGQRFAGSGRKMYTDLAVRTAEFTLRNALIFSFSVVKRVIFSFLFDSADGLP